MVDALLKYVENEMQKGNSVEIIKSHLARQGYSPALVDGVIESVMMRKSSSPSPAPVGRDAEKSTFPKILIVIVFLGLIIAGVLVVPGMLKPKQALLDVKAIPDKVSYMPGEQLGFRIEVSNMGSAEKFDINIIYRVLDKNDNTLLSKEETLAISTSMSQHIILQLPSTFKPGDYILKVFANYGGKVATSSFSFEVTAKPVVQPNCNDNKRNQDETGPDCGGVCGGYWYDNGCHADPQGSTDGGGAATESCNDNLKNQDETGPDCGGVCGGYWYDNSCHTSPKPVTPAKPSVAAVLIQARNMAATDSEQAKSLCQTLEQVSDKDKCFKNIAAASMKKEYCELIAGISDRDECYYPFFMQGDYSVCDQLTDPQSKQSCEQLKELSTIAAQLNQTNTAQ